MPIDAQARRTSWLRRVRLVTIWITVTAVLATLLIVGAARGASSSTAVARTVSDARRARPTAVVHYRRATAHQLRAYRRNLELQARARRKQRAAARPVVVAKVPPPPPAPPRPAPPVAPVVVSGGS